MTTKSTNKSYKFDVFGCLAGYYFSVDLYDKRGRVFEWSDSYKSFPGESDLLDEIEVEAGNTAKRFHDELKEAFGGSVLAFEDTSDGGVNYEYSSCRFSLLVNSDDYREDWEDELFEDELEKRVVWRLQELLENAVYSFGEERFCDCDDLHFDIELGFISGSDEVGFEIEGVSEV